MKRREKGGSSHDAETVQKKQNVTAHLLTVHHAPFILSVFRGLLAAHREVPQKEKSDFHINC